MKIASDDQRQHVLIELLESEDQHLPSRQVRVVVDLGDFRAQTTVWLGRDAIDGAIRALESLERTRRGQLRLESMGPGELVLTLSVMDAAGHLLLECELLQRIALRDRRADLRMAGAFELDPTSLPAITASMRQLSEGIAAD